MSILLNTPFNRTQCINTNRELTTSSLKMFISDFEGIPLEDLVIVRNGHTLQNDDKVTKNQMHQVFLRLHGGKGGFGSMLRAIGAQIEKTTNREACRDLSGRRLRDINDEKRLKTWIAKQAERERETERHRKERLERRLAMPKHEFKDPTYEAQRLAIPEKVDEAVYQGLFKNGDAGPSHKRKYDSKKTSEDAKKIKSKKSCLWIGVEVDSDLSEPEEDEDSGGNHSTDLSSRLCTASTFCEDSDTTDSITSNGFVSNTSLPLSSELSLSTNYNLKEICENAESTCNSEASSSKLVPHSIAAKSKDYRYNSRDKGTGIEQPGQNEMSQQVAHTIAISDLAIKGIGVDQVDQNETSQNIQHFVTIKSNDLPDPKRTNRELKQAAQSETVKLVTNLPTSKENIPVSCTLNLDNYHLVEELEALGLEELKFALLALGLKCGGTLRQRAERLLAVKGLQHHEIDATLFAKSTKKK